MTTDPPVEQCPAVITYNPVYQTTYIGEHPEQGYVYRLATRPQPDLADAAIERAARALWLSEWHSPPPHGWENVVAEEPDTAEDYRASVRAVIAALQEPDDG